MDDDYKPMIYTGISFELFERFLNKSIIEANYDNVEEFHIVKNIFLNNTTETIWKYFYAYCEHFIYLNISIREFYSSLLRISQSKVNKLLGIGSSTIVFNYDLDKVIKIYDDMIDFEFYRYIKDNPIKVFPTIYKIVNNIIVTERLQLYTPDIHNIFNHLNTRINGKTLLNWTFSKEVFDTRWLNKDQHRVYDWCIECKDNMIFKTKWPGDLSINNVGQRQNGDIVFFDI